MKFRLVADYEPAGDQPKAINQLVESLRRGTRLQTLLGVTGSGKTFTMANLIQQLQRPALVISHNKTLAAQLYSEFQAFFPHSRCLPFNFTIVATRSRCRYILIPESLILPLRGRDYY